MFETANLRLRGVLSSDGDSLYRLYNDPLVTPWITLNHQVPRHGSEKEALIKKSEASLLGCIVEEKSSTHFVGIAGFLPQLDPRNRNVILYIGFLPSFWGKGYGYEVMELLMRHAFWEMGMHKVSLKVLEDNERGLKLYKKLGFKEEGRDRHVIWTRGAWRDMIRMGILEDEWREREKAHAIAATFAFD